ncbi:MAG TPA: prolipoprotein diacylglyceryl transferase [Polyangia bacterium]|jgi:phosphatidylglycerol:prolipoprotein diacylglycerol transferase|nr:prolipoprotein diacylglyceryl transferase [Polyangia bacterium]
MRPLFFSVPVGGHEVGVHTYGLLIAVGLAVGIALGAREARRRGLDVGRVLDFAFWATVAGLVGSRVAYGLVNLHSFVRACMGDPDEPRGLLRALSDCTRLVQVWEGGLVFYGGIVGAAIVAVVFARRERWSFWVLGDVFAPGVAVGHVLGRLGCFAAGCCFGKPSGPWGVAFPAGSIAFDELGSVGQLSPGASFTPPLHPTQLYEAGGELAIFALLMALRPRLRARPGTLMLLYGALYSVLRFVVELFRGDFARRYIVELSTPRLAALLGVPTTEPELLSVGQLVSVVLFAACVAAFIRRGVRTPAP